MAASENLRAALEGVLARESDRTGHKLRFDVREQQHVDAACRAADAVELLDLQIVVETAGEARGSLIVKYMSERRLQDDKVSEHLKWLDLSEFAPLKSPQHALAGAARWAGNPRVRGRKGSQ